MAERQAAARDAFHKAAIRLAAPACPVDAAPIDLSQPADASTTAAYFASAEPKAQHDFVLQWAAGDLVRYGEPPLPTLAYQTNAELYRVLATGPFGEMLVIQSARGQHVVRGAERSLCEDRDIGIATRRWGSTLEGVRDGEHLVRTFSRWQPNGRHVGLARCVAMAAPGARSRLVRD